MLIPLAHIGHWAWLEPLAFAPAFAALVAVFVRDHRARRRNPTKETRT